MRNYIYILKDPISNEIRYVGKSNNPENRLKRHLNSNSLLESWTSKNKWLLNLKKKGLSPIMEVIDYTELGNINELEIKWIKHYRDLGLKLTNSTDGGDGVDWTGKKHTLLSIDKMRMNHPFRKSIIQFDLNNNILNIHTSIRECAISTNLDRRHISLCCKNGKNKTVGGFYFRYYLPCVKLITEPNIEYINSKIDEFNLSKPTYITKRKELNNKIKEGNKAKRKSIIHYDLDGNILGNYKTMSEARNITGCHIGLISNCCNKKSYYTVNNSTFRYEFDEFDYIPYNISIQVNSRRICKYDLNGGLIHIYDSIKQAVREN
jgi:hypothetical protein